MFTGIIKGIGCVAAVDQHDGYRTLFITGPDWLYHLPIGASIAVNGACLTIKEQKEHGITLDVMAETLKKTNLGLLNTNSPINLEPALCLGDRLDGHWVQGHVDTTARLQALQPIKENYILSIEMPQALSPYFIPKGSVTLDGTSLTLIDVNETHFTVMLIPHTLEHTISQFYHQGQQLNIETDILAKYTHQWTTKQ